LPFIVGLSPAPYFSPPLPRGVAPLLGGFLVYLIIVFCFMTRCFFIWDSLKCSFRLHPATLGVTPPPCTPPTDGSPCAPSRPRHPVSPPHLVGVLCRDTSRFPQGPIHLTRSCVVIVHSPLPCSLGPSDCLPLTPPPSHLSVLKRPMPFKFWAPLGTPTFPLALWRLASFPAFCHPPFVFLTFWLFVPLLPCSMDGFAPPSFR